jgi:hypothetical protein
MSRVRRLSIGAQTEKCGSNVNIGHFARVQLEVLFSCPACLVQFKFYQRDRSSVSLYIATGNRAYEWCNRSCRATHTCPMAHIMLDLISTATVPYILRVLLLRQQATRLGFEMLNSYRHSYAILHSRSPSLSACSLDCSSPRRSEAVCICCTV